MKIGFKNLAAAIFGMGNFIAKHMAFTTVLTDSFLHKSNNNKFLVKEQEDVIPLCFDFIKVVNTNRSFQNEKNSTIY